MKPKRSTAFTAFAIVALLAYALPARCAPWAFASDARLAAEVTLQANSKTVSDVLAGLPPLGVHLTADPVLANSPITARLNPRPARDALQLVADLLLAEWVPDRDGYRLTVSKLGADKEAEIRAKRDWTVSERLKRIRAGLAVTQQDWVAITDKLIESDTVFRAPDSKPIKPPAGFVLPDDVVIGESLSSPYRHALYKLVAALPDDTWEAAKDSDGVDLPIAGFAEADRKALAEIISGGPTPLPGRGDRKEYWPKFEDRQLAAEALESGKGKLRFRLQPDWLGRWTSFGVMILTRGYPNFSDIPVGRNFPMDHTFWHVVMIGRNGRQTMQHYLNVAPDADTAEAVHDDDWFFEKMGSLQWPQLPKASSGLPRDGLLAALHDKIGIEYLATRYVDREGMSTYNGPQMRGWLIEGTAGALDANWERVNGAILFRERDWPLKRDRCIPNSFLERLSAKRSPEGYLSIDDLAAAAAELTVKQKRGWQDSGNNAPMDQYMRLICRDREHAFDIWRQLTADQKQRMKIDFDPGPNHDPFAGGKGISIHELDPNLQKQLIARLQAEGRQLPDKDGDIRLGWMHYRVSDGYERDRMSYIVTDKDGHMRYGSCFFEFFHPKPGQT